MEGSQKKASSGFSGLTLTLTSSPRPKSNPASPQHPEETPAILRSILRFHLNPSTPPPTPSILGSLSPLMSLAGFLGSLLFKLNLYFLSPLQMGSFLRAECLLLSLKVSCRE